MAYGVMAGYQQQRIVSINAMARMPSKPAMAA